MPRQSTRKLPGHRRFFISPEAITGSRAVLTGADAHHLATVLRMQPDDSISLLDGTGKIYLGHIAKITRKQIEIDIVSWENYQENGPRLHLGQGIVKGGKMDLIIQKATELGVHDIHPISSAYSVIQESRRLERWRKIAHEACKQCGRPAPPEVTPVRPFADFIKDQGCQGRFLLWEEEHENTLTPGLFNDFQSVALVIGPEGGFHPDEITLARAAGFRTITLGSRILRAETATIAAIAIIQHLLGNLD